jgi:hypothetical protein
MANNNLTLDLKSRRDKDGKTFYVAKLRGPFSIDCTDGVVFLIYTSEIGCEEMQVAAMDTKNQDD